jgi:hypothetical protein
MDAETPGQWLAAAFAWIGDLPLQGPAHHCWKPEQRLTLERLLAGFQEANEADLLRTHLTNEKTAPKPQRSVICSGRSSRTRLNLFFQYHFTRLANKTRESWSSEPSCSH